MEKGQMEIAKIHAENAIRHKNHYVNMLKLSSRIEAVASRMQSAQRTKEVEKSLGKVVVGMNQTMKSLDLEKTMLTMDKFEDMCTTMDAQLQVMEDGMAMGAQASLTPVEQVDDMLSQIADE